MSFTSDPNIVRQQETLEEFTITSSKKFLPIDPNILNSYRSYTYNFTIAAWPKSIHIDVNATPRETKLNLSDFKNIILASSGKPSISVFDQGFDDTGEVDSFNSNSSGRYNLYIDNIEIDTIPTPGSNNGNTIATKIEFDIYEPYSVVGFLESLRAAAVSAGYTNYLEASYLLLLQFKGYNDQEDLPSPTVLPVDRFFKIKFLDVDVNVDLTGTKYKCSAVPINEFALSNVVGSIKYPIQMSGEKVYDITKDFIKKLNENILEEARKVDKKIKPDQVDSYEIQFPVSEKSQSVQKIGGELEEAINEIGNASVKELSVNNTIYQFEDLSKTTKRTAYQQSGNPTEFVSYEPDKLAITFYEGAFIHEIISSLVRDSTFWTNQVNPETGKLDEPGKIYFKFWRIIPNLEIGEYSPFHKREIYKVTYLVVPQEMHISMLPPNRVNSYDPEDLNILRRYDYIYTGKNTDVLNLKINFNKLFYERVTVGLGNNDRNISQNSDKPSGSDDNIADSETISESIPGPAAQPGGSPTLETIERRNIPAQGAGNAINPTSAKSYLAKDYYDILLSDSVSMIEVDLEIIGDPIWIASYDGILVDTRSLRSKGPYAYYVRLYFRNPTDLDDTDLNDSGTGLLKFSNKNIQFSGIYMVKKIESKFKGGVFTQLLKLIRLPFVEDAESTNEPIINNSFSTISKEDDKVVPSTNQPIPLDKRSSLKNLVGGVNKLADSIQNIESQITGAIQGAAAGIAGVAAQVVAVPGQAVAKITNSIQGKLQNINNTAVDAANKFNLSPSQLGSLSGKELLTIVALSKILPDNISFEQLEENGVLLPNKDSLKTVPPLEKKTDESSIQSSANEIQQNFENLTNSFPTNSPTILRNIPP